MAQVLKPVRLVNPGKRRRSTSTRRNPGSKRRMSLAQKLHFGTKRQRAAAQASLHRKRSRPKAANPGRRKRRNYGTKFGRTWSRYKPTAGQRKASNAKYRRTQNVGEIITIRPLTNSGRKRKRLSNTSNMARRRTRRKAVGSRVRYHRRRRTANPATRVHRRRRRRTGNPSMRTRTVVRYRNRSTHRRRSYRRNPGAISTGAFGSAINIVAGALVTKFVVEMLPAGISQGIPGYIASAVIATLQGKAIGKLLKNPGMGNQMATGGYVYTVLKIANDLMPSFGLPFKLNGMGGVYGPSSFYVPQVNQYGSMANFVAPSAIGPAMVPTGGGAMRGLSARRMGRMS